MDQYSQQIRFISDPESLMKNYEQMGLSQQQIFNNINFISEYLSNSSEFMKAIKFYEKLIALHPENGNAFVALGHCYTIIGENEKALNSYQSALNFLKDIKDSQLWIGIAECSEKLKKIEQSFISYEFILSFTQSKSEKAKASLKLGKYLFLYSYFHIALEYLNKAIVLKDHLSIHLLIETYLLFGLVYQEKKCFADSIIYFKKALSIDPNNIQIILQIAWTYFLQGEFIESDEYLDKALQLESNCEDIYYIKSRILLSKHNEKEALQKLEIALSINKSNPLYYCSLGIIHTILNEYLDAYNDFLNCLHSKDFMDLSLFNIGLLYEICNQPLDAIFAYENILNELTDNVNCKSRLEILKGKNKNLKNELNSDDLKKLMMHSNLFIYEDLIPKSKKDRNNEMKEIINTTLEIHKSFSDEVIIKYLKSYFQMNDSLFTNNQLQNFNYNSNSNCNLVSNSCEISKKNPSLLHVKEPKVTKQDIEELIQLKLKQGSNILNDFDESLIHSNHCQNQMLPFFDLVKKIELNTNVNSQFPLLSKYPNRILKNNNNPCIGNLIQNNTLNNYSYPLYQINQMISPSNVSPISQTNSQSLNNFKVLKSPSLANYLIHSLNQNSEINQENISKNFSQQYIPQNQMMFNVPTNSLRKEGVATNPHLIIQSEMENHLKDNYATDNFRLCNKDFKNELNMFMSPPTKNSQANNFYTPEKKIVPISQINHAKNKNGSAKLNKERLRELSRIADNFNLDNLKDNTSTIVKISLNHPKSNRKEDLIETESNNLKDENTIIKNKRKRHQIKNSLDKRVKKKIKK